MCMTVFPHFYSRMEPRRNTKREVTATLRRAVKSDSNFRCHVSCCSFWTHPGFDVPPLFLTPLAASLQNKSLRLYSTGLNKGWLKNSFSRDKECATLWHSSQDNVCHPFVGKYTTWKYSTCVSLKVSWHFNLADTFGNLELLLAIRLKGNKI